MQLENRLPPLIMNAFSLLLMFAAAATQATSDPSEVTAAERTEVIDSVATLLSAEYIDPDAAERMARSLRAKSRQGNYDGLRAGDEFAARLTTDLREIAQDKHLWIGFRPEGARTEPIEGPSPEELDQWRPEIAKDNFAFDRVERLPGNIGYVKFRIFAYPRIAAQTASAAMTFAAHTDALIIDLRDNLGGDPDMVAFLASYLFDRPVQLNDIRYRRGNRIRQYWTLPYVPGVRFGEAKPVFILTSAATFSAAEDFSYALQTRKRATIVGETTGGGARPAREFRVTQRFVAAIPHAESISPITGTNWERKGVVPDLAVPAADAMQSAYLTALTKLIETTENPGRKAEWRKLLENPVGR